ncbi:hypothetical protein [Kitasatospora herbaricolor]|uniref:hypothetical protein n=1 Tax=Kitasatospora herbaricolor TaxID=68217 RepID=UPI0036DBC748
MAGEATFGTDSGVGSTIALLEAQLPAARERRGRLEEELAAAVARESAITSVLEGLRALSGTHLDGQADPQDAVEAPAPDPIPGPSLTEAAEPVTSASDGQAAAADGSTEGRTDVAPASSEPAATTAATTAATPVAKPVRKTAGRGTTTRAAATKRTAAKKPDAGRKTIAGKAAVVTSTAPDPEQGITPAAVAVAKRAGRRSAPKAAPDAEPKETGPRTAKKAGASVRKAAPKKAAPEKAARKKAATAKAVPAKVVPAKVVSAEAVPAEAVPAPGKAPATVDVPAPAVPAPVTTAPVSAASTTGRRRLTDAEGVLAVLAQAQNPLRAREVAGLLGLDGADTTVNAIRTRLERLAKSGHALRSGRGLYTVAADRPGTAG